MKSSDTNGNDESPVRMANEDKVEEFEVEQRLVDSISESFFLDVMVKVRITFDWWSIAKYPV